MKVLHVSSRDTKSGAARAACRLHRALLGINVESRMLVQTKDSDDHTVIGPSNDLEKAFAKLRPRLDRLPLKLYPDRDRLPYSVQWVPSRIYSRINGSKPDLINLHWICEGFLNVEAIGRLNKPIVWSLHDMWPFTGGCHCDLGCGRYRESCGMCPRLNSETSLDVSRWVWRRKSRAWQDSDLTIVCPSTWLAHCVRDSSLLKGARTEVIPNGLDTRCFKPIDRGVARDLLNLPLHKQLILVGILGNQQIKGLDLLLEALRTPEESWWKNRDLVTIGTSPLSRGNMGIRMHHLGFLRDSVALVAAYSAADVVVVSSVQEAFGQIGSESLACGTPVVAFGATGTKDVVDHGHDGYLAEPFEPEELSHGIDWVLANEERRQLLSRNARRKAVQQFDQEIQAKRYSALYEDILSRR